MAKEYLKNYLLPDGAVRDIVDKLNAMHEDVTIMYDLSFRMDEVMDEDDLFLDSVKKFEDEKSIKALLESYEKLLDLLHLASTNLMYNPTKASIEAKCTLRDVYLRKGFTPEYLDDWAMGLLGKSKTLWKADF